MKTNYSLTLVALLLFILAGCTDASNPVGLEADLRFAEETRSLSTEASETTIERSEIDGKLGSGTILEAKGKIAFTRNKSDDFLRPRSKVAVEENVVGFSVGLKIDETLQDSGYLEFQDSAGPDFSVQVQHVQMNDDGSVSFDGPISSTERLGASWFFARASDGGQADDRLAYSSSAPDMGDSFSYYIGISNDEPTDQDFLEVTITTGNITIVQNAF